MLKIAIKNVALAGVTTLFLCGIPISAMAETSPFDILKSYSVDVKEKNYTKLSKSLSLDEAKAIDAAFSAKYGEPRVTREGLKVWEVPNLDAKRGEAEHITIMCGREKGGFYISVDARGPGEGNQADRKKLRERSKAERQVLSQSNAAKSTVKRQSPARLRPELQD